jgi:hypothetical protein
MARKSPADRMAGKIKDVPVDYSGMDAEMASTIGGQAKNEMKKKALYALSSKFGSVKSGGSSTAPKKKKFLGLF